MHGMHGGVAHFRCLGGVLPDVPTTTEYRDARGRKMSGRISIVSYDDLEPNHQPIDRNPRIPCNICGEKFTWQDYWKERIVESDGDPRDEDFWCDGCTDEILTLWKRRSENQKLDAYNNE